MEKVFYKKGVNKVPIKSWTKTPEEGCLAQANNLSNLPFVHKHVSLMPDTHQGYGMPIGGVLATDGVIIPNAVGVDIGCGMAFLETNVPYKSIVDVTTKDGTFVKTVLNTWNKVIPTGFSAHKEIQTTTGSMDSKRVDNGHRLGVVCQQLVKADYQRGTLGGGNHFLELQQNEKGNLCIMIHSGSRKLGFEIAKHFAQLAKDMNEKWHSSVDPSWDLAFFPLDSQEGQDYITAMNYAIEYAKDNRQHMIIHAKNVLYNLLRKYAKYQGSIEEVLELNVPHNYAEIENHFGKNVWVHRKGAIRARKGDVAMIPGSMGTNSYIVMGLGEKNSFTSASHGAGRMMGRKEAQRRFTREDVEADLKHRGVELTKNKMSDVADESPWAYKDIDAVIEAETDLITVIQKLKPLGTVKG